MEYPTITAAERVGRHVRAALAEHAKQIRDLEPILGFTHAAVSRRLSGQIPFRCDELIAIGEALGVDPGRFLAPIPQQRTTSPSTAGAAA